MQSRFSVHSLRIDYIPQQVADNIHGFAVILIHTTTYAKIHPYDEKVRNDERMARIYIGREMMNREFFCSLILWMLSTILSGEILGGDFLGLNYSYYSRNNLVICDK